MFRRFHHGHSAALGFLLALSLQAHVLWLVTGAFLLGALAGRTWAFWTEAARAVKAKLLAAKPERISTVPVPVYTGKLRDDQPLPYDIDGAGA